MPDNKKPGRKPKNGYRTSILIDQVTKKVLEFLSYSEGKSKSAIIQKALEEYFVNHYEGIEENKDRKTDKGHNG